MNKSLEAYLVNLDMPLAFRLRAFYERYCRAGDEAYLHLAVHAAFPIAMTPDLLYKIWLNFREDGQGNELKIPYVAVSDLLLSSLYRATGRNTFEMPDGIRTVLLDYLQGDPRFGEERKDELAYFLRAYLQENPQAIPSEAFRRAQDFIVKLRLEWEVAAEELLKAYNQAKHVGQIQHLLNMAKGELKGQELAEDGQKNPLAVATEFVRGVQEYKSGNREKGLELLERLKGRLSKGGNGGIRVNLEQRILEALPAEMELGYDERPVFFGVFNSSVSGTAQIKSIQEKDLILKALESVKELNSLALVDKTWEELNSISKSVKERVLIFHFAGHGEKDKLIFEDGSINPDQLADFLSQFPNLKLVFLNSMRSERFIEKLVESGIPVVLATYGDIADSQAISFAHNFYEQLALNTGLSDAYTFAKSKPWSLETNSEFIDFRGFKPKQTTYYLYQKSEHDEQWKLIDAIQLFLEQQRATKQAKKEDKVFPAQLNKIPFLKEGEVCLGRLDEIKLLDNKVKNQKSPVFIVGKQGVGKTTLLRAYIHQHHRSFKHVLWLNLNTGLSESVISDPNLVNLIEEQADNNAKEYNQFVKLTALLNTISGPNLLIIDSAKEKLQTKKIIELLPNSDNWKVIISSRTNKGFNPIGINPLKPEAALILFNSHYQNGKDSEKSKLLKTLERIPDRIIQVAKFLNQFKGSLSIQSLLKAAEQKKLNINKIAEFLSKSENATSLGLKIKSWLELNGEKEVIQDAVLKHLDGDTEAQEINRVLVAWLNTNGDPSFIFEYVKRYLVQYANELGSGIVFFFWIEKTRTIKDVEVYLKKHLDLHADKKETCNLMIYWLWYGGEPKAIKPLVKKHLDLNGQNEPSHNLLGAWLGASRDIDLVRDNVVKALRQHLGAEQIALIVSAWLEAGGELDVVQESVQLFMQLGPMELFTSSIIQGWLKAGGETKVVEAGMLRYLDKFATNKEARFIMIAWLEASGNPQVLNDAISEFFRVYPSGELSRTLMKLFITKAEADNSLKHIEEERLAISTLLNLNFDIVNNHEVLNYLKVNSVNQGAALVLNKCLEAKWDINTIAPFFHQYLDKNATSTEASFVIQSWLNAGADKAEIQDAMIQFLDSNSNKGAKGTPLVINSWLEAEGDKKLIQDFLVRYLQLNVTEPEAAIVFNSWLNANGDKSIIQDSLKKYLQFNAEQPDAQFVLCSWLDAGGDKALIQESIFKYLHVNREAKEASLVISSWLVANGDKAIVKGYLVDYLQSNAEKPEARHVIKAWLNSGGDPSLVQNALISYLNKYAQEKEASFAIAAWLDAKGDKKIIKKALLLYLNTHAQTKNAAFVIQAWLSASGDLTSIQDKIIQYLNKYAEEKEAAFVISSWLLARGGKSIIQEYLIRHLRLNAEKSEARHVIKAWLDTGGDRKIVNKAWNVYLENNIEQPEASLVIVALIQAEEPTKSLRKWVRKYLDHFPVTPQTFELVKTWVAKIGVHEITETLRFSPSERITSVTIFELEMLVNEEIAAILPSEEPFREQWNNIQSIFNILLDFVETNRMPNDDFYAQFHKVNLAISSLVVKIQVKYLESYNPS